MTENTVTSGLTVGFFSFYLHVLAANCATPVWDAAGDQLEFALSCHIFEVFAHLLQFSPRGLLHVDSGPQHVVERSQEVMTDVQGKLLNGLHLSDRIL